MVQFHTRHEAGELPPADIGRVKMKDRVLKIDKSKITSISSSDSKILMTTIRFVNGSVMYGNYDLSRLINFSEIVYA